MPGIGPGPINARQASTLRTLQSLWASSLIQGPDNVVLLGLCFARDYQATLAKFGVFRATTGAPGGGI